MKPGYDQGLWADHTMEMIRSSLNSNPSASSSAREANYKHTWIGYQGNQAYGTILLQVNPSVAVVANSS